MLIFPAIDLSDGCVVRLYRGDYNKKTVYSANPPEVASLFAKAGAEWLHVVDLDGAKSGCAEAAMTVSELVKSSGLKIEIGGGIRNAETVARYFDIGVSRVILGTAALRDRVFLEAMVNKYGDKIAVGADIRDGSVSVQGWTEDGGVMYIDFLDYIESIGVKTVICTDISKDGAMNGTNCALYRELAGRYSFDIVASGGVTAIEDVKSLAGLGLYGAIIGRALYTGNIDLAEAVKAAAAETTEETGK